MAVAGTQMLDAAEKLMISSSLKARPKVAAESEDLTRTLERLQRELDAEKQVRAPARAACAGLRRAVLT